MRVLHEIPLDDIADLYYMDDCVQLERGWQRFLIGMREALVERAIEK